MLWGAAGDGGDSSAAHGQLKNVKHQAATGITFAALGDGSLVTWGDATDDGDCIAMQGQLKNNMQQIQPLSLRLLLFSVMDRK